MQVLARADDLTAPVADQGRRPVCVPLAVTAAHELVRDDGLALASEALWHHARSRGLTSTAGTTVQAVADALAEQGQPEEATWPFDLISDGPQSIPEDAGTPPWLTGTVRFVDPTVEDVQFELFGSRPVVAVIELTDVFHTLVGGVLPDPAADAPGLGLHAVVVVALGRDSDGLYFLLRNSWGAGWGNGGYAWISAGHLGGRLRQAVAVSANAVQLEATAKEPREAS